MRLRPIEHSQTVLALVALSHVTAQIVGHELLSITNAEHGARRIENRGINVGAVTFIDAVGPARDDQAGAAAQFGRRSIARADFRVHTQIANLSGDEMTVLAARVEDGDLWSRLVLQILWPRVAIGSHDDQLF